MKITKIFPNPLPNRLTSWTALVSRDVLFMEEIWKDIPNYEGLYQISNLGNVKSLFKIVVYNNTKRIQQEKIISKRVSGSGYYQHALHKQGVHKMYLTHRLVAQSFVPNPENKPQVNHKNGIKTDNRVENLEWNTQSENQFHAVRNGLQPYCNGEKRGRVCKLDWNSVRDIKKKLSEGVKNRALAKLYNVNPVTISDIKRNKTWLE